MFRKLRFQFIAITTLAITLILMTLVGVINTVRYLQTEHDIQAVLDLLTENNGTIPDTKENRQTFDQQFVSQGTLYNFNYFSARIKANEAIINPGTANHLTSEQIQGFVDQSGLQSFRDRGYLEEDGRYFSYRISPVSETERLVVFFETTQAFRDRWSLLVLSIQIAAISWLAFVVVVNIFSGLAIRPFVRNYDKQRSFITNAGHELKTPLAVIAANNELQELLTGETEWTQSTKDQVDRLDHLIAKLIRLARLEERKDQAPVTLDFSQLVQRVSHNMSALWEQEGLHYEADIQEGISLQGVPDDLYELVSILLDNARKYCDPQGTVRLQLANYKPWLRKGRAVLTVSNDYAAGQGQDYRLFFDRFYRSDQSRTRQVVSQEGAESDSTPAGMGTSPAQGYGIGLSMAQNIVSLHRGKISVHYKDGVIRFVVSL